MELKLKLKKITEYYRDGPVEIDTEIEPKKKSIKKGVEAFGNFELNEIRTICSANEKKRLKIEYNVDACRISNIFVF